MRETTSKTIDGITDLVVIAPIKEGFIKAFETISYASRLELAASALNKVRVAAREYERAVPYSDVTERILSLLDFRVGVLDRDLFGFAPGSDDTLTLTPRRYLYLTATFESGFEPYMRQIWRPLGTFLDLLFCNCEGYVTATEHGFEEYIQWVRDHQMDSAIFYSTTGLTVRDHKYLAGLERAQRSGASSLELAKLTMSYPEDEAAKTRDAHFLKAVELALEAINVLHKLADYYPPEWMTGPIGEPAREGEGHRLLRVTRSILDGWDPLLHKLEAAAAMDPGGRAALLLKIYEAPLDWYRSGTAHLQALDAAAVKPDPALPPGEVQAGILKSHGSAATPTQHGALMLFSVRDADTTRGFLQHLINTGILRFDGHDCAPDAAPLAANIAFTPQGLLEMGMFPEILERFPKEFREGLAQRSGLVGDMRENHPRNWMLPERNGPALLGVLPPDLRLPVVGLDEVDFVLQLRSSQSDAAAFRAAALDLAREGMACVALQSVEWLHADYDEAGRFRDHFGFIDGISQPRPRLPGKPAKGLARDQVALGEVLLGYANDRGDGPPELFDTLDAADRSAERSTAWRRRDREAALKFQANGSYLVVRKIGTNVQAFDAWLDLHKDEIAAVVGCSPGEARARLKAAVMGRNDDGTPLVPAISADPNDFDYRDDTQGLRCPHAAHVRRANPRRIDADHAAPAVVRREFDRPTPRLLRRGMLFGEPGTASRGLMFMAYAASLSEQYEVIQRWLNGGNPTDIASANNDPLTGVRPRQGEGAFRFVTEAKAADGSAAEIVLSLPLPQPDEPGEIGTEPGRHPFTPLYWGLYLFAPARTLLATMITSWKGGYKPFGNLLEQAVGDAQIRRLGMITSDDIRAREWKRLLDDFMTRDPSERDISPHVWSAIRYYCGGVLEIGTAALVPPASFDPARWDQPDWDTQRVSLCAGTPQVMQVLAEWENFTSEEHLRRIIPNAGPIYVTQQPDNDYQGLSGDYEFPLPDGTMATQKLDYHRESHATNSALRAYPEERAFVVGYAAGRAVMEERKLIARKLGRTAFKLELRREFFQPALAELWRLWYGLPDDDVMKAGAWSWKRIVDTVTNAALERDHALCPGDFMAPSRGSMFPRPNASIKDFAQLHGTAILKAGRIFVARLRADTSAPRTELIDTLLKDVDDNEVLARNIIGTMIGAIPPMEANMRNVVFEWLHSKRLWRHQAAFLQTLGGRAPGSCVAEAIAALSAPVAQAMCIRPAPDILYRTVKRKATITRYPDSKEKFDLGDAEVNEGDMIIVSLVSASQWALHKDPTGARGLDVIFGGKREAGSQGYLYGPDGVKPDPDARNDQPVHACPAQAMAMGGMKGILAALLEAGRIEALPASMILRISDW